MARRIAAVPFLLRGLSRGERCLYVAGPAATDQVRQLLAAASVDPAAAECSGRLTFADWSRFRRDGGQPALSGLASLVAAGKGAGNIRRPVLRVVLEMSDILSGAEDLPALLEFEVRLRRDVLARHRCVALCLYDQAQIDPVLAQALARVHPFPACGEAVLRNRSCEAPTVVLAGLRLGQPWVTGTRAPTNPPPDGVPPLPRGSETVLLVEYHPQVRRNVADALASLGYTVLQASDTRDIPQALRSYDGTVDLLLTDIVGDEEDGFLLAHALADRLSRPGLVLLTACASRSALGAHPPGTREDLLVRAAAITAVATAVRQVLDARAAERA